MVLQKSKCVAVTPNGTWQSKYGLLYKFEVAFENGDVGEYSSKTQDQNKFVVGNETDYELHSREYNGKTYYNVKPVLQQMNAQGFAPRGARNEDTQIQIIRQTCIKASVELAVSDRIDVSQVIEIAQQLVEYVQSGDVKKVDIS